MSFAETQTTSFIEPEGQEITTTPPYAPAATTAVAAIPILPELEPTTSVEPKGRLKDDFILFIKYLINLFFCLKKNLKKDENQL